MSRASPEPCGIAVFARAPVAGAAKTRLIPLLGAEGSAALHAALVRRALSVAAAARRPGGGIGEVALWCEADTSHPFFVQCGSEFAIGLRGQAAGDLGLRMLHAFEATSGPLLLIGSDCPAITPELLLACAGALCTGKDAVFLPAEDGGYGLVGLRHPVPALFTGIPWGSEHVMEATRVRLRQEGLSWSEPAIIWDVDRPEDVARLEASGLLPKWRPGAF